MALHVMNKRATNEKKKLNGVPAVLRAVLQSLAVVYQHPLTAGRIIVSA